MVRIDMADYYTQASFIIPCAKSKAVNALHALNYLEEAPSAYIDSVLKKSDSEMQQNGFIDKIIQFCIMNHPDQTNAINKPLTDFDWNFNAELSSEGLWIYGEESINTEHAAIFTQAVLKTFDLPILVCISAAHSCSRNRLDGFGGHGVAVTKEFIHWYSLDDLLEAESHAIQNSERFFICKLTEVNQGRETESQFLIQGRHGLDTNEFVEHRLSQRYGQGLKSPDKLIWFPGPRAFRRPQITEITPNDYRVMNQYLECL